MPKNIEHQENPEDSSFQALELKANLNPEQRAYLEVLKDKTKKILGNKTKQELAKAGDLMSLKNYKAILEEILEFLRTKKLPKQFDLMSDDPELKKEQLSLIDEAINEINSNKSGDPEIIGKLKALNIQKEIVAKSREVKTDLIPEEDVRIDAKTVIQEREVWDEIKKIGGWPEEYYFLIKRATDNKNNLLYLDIGVTGHPETGFTYILNGRFGRVGSSSNTAIERLDIDLETLEVTPGTRTAAEYSEKEKKWIEKVVNKK